MSDYLCPYIRGTNKKYGTNDNGGFWGENGYNCIEVGYLKLDGDAKEILDVIVLQLAADVVSIGDYTEGIPKIACDCLGDGYLRFFTRDNNDIKWRHDELPLSDMQLIYGKPLT